MSVYEGIYKSFLQGVSQQTPQERSEGQLGEQLNMLSDPVTGIRRRGGLKSLSTLAAPPSSYFEIVEYDGVAKGIIIDTNAGNAYILHNLTDPSASSTLLYSPYFKTTSGKGAIKTVTIGNDYYIVNTDKIPKLIDSSSVPPTGLDPRKHGYFSVRGSEFGKKFSISIGYGITYKEFSVTASTSVAAQASPEYIANSLMSAILGDSTLASLFNVSILGSTVALQAKSMTSGETLEIETTMTGGYLVTSGISRVNSRSELLGTLPPVLDKYIIGVGVTGNSAYYQYNNLTKVWSEVGVYAKPQVYVDVPKVLDISKTTAITATDLDLKKRSAGDTKNNPNPSFLDYGITGIGAYQSRLVILSGSYVCLSKTTDYTEFMRTTVTELLDDDPIEISSASLSAAQFEYAVSFNKDLVLIAQGQQAVIPANNTVLTPKTAVIYPSTTLQLSLAAKPVIAARTMYYVYQRGAEFYQVGEFIPNTYTDAQYYSQNLTDHLPLYAEGVCTNMTTSGSTNMLVFCSGTTDLLVHQFLWVGEERPLMAFHKWRFDKKVMYAQFLREFLVLFMDDGAGGIIIGTVETQLNQLDDKPIPYLDHYTYFNISGGQSYVPTAYSIEETPDLVGVIYDSATARHKEVAIEYLWDSSIIKCAYEGTIAVGKRYKSTFMLTPPFMKDDNGKVILGTRSTIQQLRMTFKSTGSFEVTVRDNMGEAYHGENDTALTWSEADLGYTWVNSIGAVVVPCRTRLVSTECTVCTEGTTDLNLVSTEYVLRVAQKRRRL